MEIYVCKWIKTMILHQNKKKRKKKTMILCNWYDNNDYIYTKTINKSVIRC
jgi:uncharacterized protein YodC (DUF2158 family)